MEQQVFRKFQFSITRSLTTISTVEEKAEAMTETEGGAEEDEAVDGADGDDSKDECADEETEVGTEHLEEASKAFAEIPAAVGRSLSTALKGGGDVSVEGELLVVLLRVVSQS